MEWLAHCVTEFRKMKGWADGAMAQISEDDFHRTIDPQSNSVAVMVQHLAGNLRSRWTDFLASDGEKPDRNRDSEFEEGRASRAELLARWDGAWKVLFATLDSLRPEDLERTVLIRGEQHAVPQAILRQISHYGYHVGQIVYLCRHLAGERWTTLSVPRGQSQQFNAEMARQELARKKQ